MPWHPLREKGRASVWINCPCWSGTSQFSPGRILKCQQYYSAFHAWFHQASPSRLQLVQHAAAHRNTKTRAHFPDSGLPPLLYACKSQNSLGPPYFYDQLLPCIALWCLGSADQPNLVDLNTKLKQEGIRFWQFQLWYSGTNCLDASLLKMYPFPWLLTQCKMLLFISLICLFVILMGCFVFYVI